MYDVVRKFMFIIWDINFVVFDLVCIIILWFCWCMNISKWWIGMGFGKCYGFSEVIC